MGSCVEIIDTNIILLKIGVLHVKIEFKIYSSVKIENERGVNEF
jgi:hypothetical protein